MSNDMYPDTYVDYVIKQEEKEAMSEETCSECGKKVKTMAFRNTGVCSENCRKIRDGEDPKQYAQTDAGITNLLNQPTGEVNLRGIK